MANNLTGHVYHRLTVIDRAGSKNGNATWLCQCSCGNKCIVRGDHLRAGLSRSCGCLRIEENTTHGATHRRGRTPTYRTWLGMRQRCQCTGDNGFSGYGAAGITVCERWQSFANFLADMGERPDGASIERIDNGQGYHPGNCRWASPREQMRNTRRTRVLTWRGRSLCLTDWAAHLGVSTGLLRRRLRNGWSVQKTLETPARHH